MRTEIEHRYKSGFVLTEQELRRIVQSCHEHAPKVGASETLRLTSKLRDGSLIETHGIDDVLSLENGGQKAITRLTIVCGDDHESSSMSSRIKVEFEDGTLNPRSWDAVSIDVVGESRDAVFVAAADLDDRVKKTHVRAWPYLSSKAWFFVLPLVISMAIGLFSLEYLSPMHSAVQQLQIEYESGRLTDPIKAMLLLEREKARNRPGIALIAFAVPAAVSFAVFSTFRHVVDRYSFCYVFYWGDMMPRYERYRNITKVFWTVIVFGVLASVHGGWILRILP